MQKFIIRNDDVASDTDINELKEFCRICDLYGYQIIQAVTPLGECRKSRATMTNDEIKKASYREFKDNKEVVEFLKSRNDFIGVHGLWHTHSPTIEEITTSKMLLEQMGLTPTYFVPPFNEGDYAEEVAGLTTCKLSQSNGDRLEDFLNSGTPKGKIMYLHSWRFNNVNYKFKHLERCLARLSEASPYRIWYNDWVKANAKGKVLEVGKSKYWNYNLPTLDVNPKLKPTYVGDIQNAPFPDETFDTVLCNGMYEFVNDPQKMIDEALRITKVGGTTLFGFVGRDYKPYRKPWKFFQGEENLPEHERVDFKNEYHFLICKKQ